MTGGELRRIRLRLGMTQGDMAAKLFVSREHVNRLEKGRKRLTRRLAAHVRLLARAG